MRQFAKKTRWMLETIRFSHTVFALPFALLAAVLAWKTPLAGGESMPFRWPVLAGILVCMVTARSAAMAFNRLVDRRLDAANPRTASRHLPAGKLTPRSVGGFALANVLLFIIATLLFLPNWLPTALSIPVLGVLLGYSLAKRFTSLAHYWLGLALMLAPVAVWIAVRGDAVMVYPADIWPAIMLGLGVFFWVGGFDIIYACQDFEFDRQANLRSIPARFGVARSLGIAAGSHCLMLVAMALVPVISRSAGLDPGLGWLWYAGLLGVAGLLVIEHRLVRPDDLTRVNIAFFNVNAVVSFGLFAIGTLDALF